MDGLDIHGETCVLEAIDGHEHSLIELHHLGSAGTLLLQRQHHAHAHLALCDQVLREGAGGEEHEAEECGEDASDHGMFF